MKKKLAALALCLSVVFGSLQAGTTQVQAAQEYTENHYELGLGAYDPAVMELSDWSNGGMFNCRWDPANAKFFDGAMGLTIDRDWNNGGYTGAECRIKKYFGYGMFQVNMKPIKNPGVVSSFFTYTGPSDGTKWDEIDIEFLGYDTTKVQFNYYTDGVGNHEYLYDLGFDASESFHTYGFYWEPGKITWYVDGNPIPESCATENIPDTPGRIMMNVWPGIGVDEWLQPYDGKTPLTAWYKWLSYDK